MNRRVTAGRACCRWSFAALAALTLAAPTVLLPVGAGASTTGEGSLDPSYGLDGRSLDWAARGTADPAPAAADVRPDGRVAVALMRGDHTIAAAQYRADGSLDTTFGGDGRTHWTTGEPQLRAASAVALQPDGAVLVGGSNEPATDGEAEIIRYTPQGTVDTAFGSGGVVQLNLTAQSDSVGALHVLSDGSILVGGVESDGMFIAKLHSDGSLVDTFGIGGSATAQANSSPTTVNDIAVDSLGRIVTAGAETSGSFSGFALTRWTADGVLDSTFGPGGSVAEAFLDLGSSTHNSANGVVVQPDGKVVVAGVISFTDPDIAVVRYNEDGSRDGGFATNGVWTTNTGPDELLNDLQLQRDGDLVAVGYTFRGGNEQNDYVVARLTAGGSLDPDFGTTSSGFSLVDFGARTDRAMAVGILRDGRIVAAGGSQEGSNFEFPSMLRMYGDLTAPSSPGAHAMSRFSMGTTATLTWPAATDDNTGVRNYTVLTQSTRYDAAGPGPAGVYKTVSTRSTSFGRNVGFTRCFVVEARDYAGNVGTPGSQACTAFPVDDRTLATHGAWTNGTGKAYYLATFRRSSSAGAALTLKVAFRHVALVATTCPTCGTVKVYLGKTLLLKKSLHATKTHNRVVIALASSSSVRTGTLRIVQSSGGKPVVIDGVAVSQY